jgi:CDP-diacylglycerol--serine O-phosphatidyltransferase
MSETNIKPVAINQNTPEEPDNTVSYHKLIPNVITLMSLAAGLSAMQFAIDGSWERAVVAIVIAGVLDTLDGAIARLLNATSEFGAQLDSFSDFLSFGVAPATILYLWVLEESGKIGWIAMVVFAVASAMRLARYNITPTPTKGVWSKGFFAGVPAPAGAGMALLPLFIWLMAPDFFESLAIINILVGIWVIFWAGMMVSRIPTWSSKQIKIKSGMVMPTLAFTALMIAAVVQAPWPMLTIIGVAYIISIPFSIRHFKKIVKDNQEKIDLAELALGISEHDDLDLKND